MLNGSMSGFEKWSTKNINVVQRKIQTKPILTAYYAASGDEIFICPESWRNAADLDLDGVNVGSNRRCRKEIQPHGEKPGPQLRDGGTGQGFSIFATCIGPRPTSADARLGCASNIPMRKAPPADDRNVDFLALTERGLSPPEVSHNPDLALHGFIPGCIPPPFRPSKAQNTLRAKTLFPPTSGIHGLNSSSITCTRQRMSVLIMPMRFQRHLKTLDGAESNLAEMRRFGGTAGGWVSDAPET
ncbi:hypothetical protein C8R43DRAFT_951700 [Mycena crocata]|nr:hypothetical protein C8R43DRAFT_951700 [Mycena crocata]